MRYKILKDGEESNTIISDEAFVTAYCAKNGYTFEEAPLPEPEPTPDIPSTDLTVWDELDAAYQEGVNDV